MLNTAYFGLALALFPWSSSSGSDLRLDYRIAITEAVSMTDRAKTGFRSGFADPNLDPNPASNLGLAYISGAVNAISFTVRKAG